MTEYAVKLDFRQIFVQEISSKLVALVVGVCSAWMGAGYWAIALGTLASPLTWVVISYIFAPFVPTLTLVEWNVFSKYLRWTTLTQLVIATNSQMDQLLLGRFVSRVELGTFSVALIFVPCQTRYLSARHPSLFWLASRWFAMIVHG